MSDPTTDPGEEYLIIGPSKAGKTCLVGVLDHASSTASIDQQGLYEVFPEGEEMTGLVELAPRIRRTGRLPWPGSVDVTTYKFLLKSRIEPTNRSPNSVRPPIVEKSKIRKHLFQLLDGPGTILFPEDYEEGTIGELSPAITGDLDEVTKVRARLVEMGRKSKGLILCLDASDPSSGGKFFESLTPAFRKMATDNVLPFERVALVLTKADRVFADQRRDAELAASQTDPWVHVEDLLGGVGIKNLVRYIDPAYRPAIYCGWASVYGFVPGEGTANYDVENDRLLVYDEKNPKFFQKWMPFRVLDPFVYLATREPLSLKPIPSKWLK